MLNTDAHNPAIKNKMTVDEFVKNNLRIGDDLKSEFLEQMYYKIVDNEIKMDVDVFSDQEKSGYLSKRQLAGWRRKWVVLVCCDVCCRHYLILICIVEQQFVLFQRQSRQKSQIHFAARSALCTESVATGPKTLFGDCR